MFSQSKLDSRTRGNKSSVWGARNREQLELLGIGLYYLNDKHKKTSLQCRVDSILSSTTVDSGIAYIVPCIYAQEALSAVRMVMDVRAEDHPDHILAQQMFLSMPIGFVALTTISP